LDRSQPVPDPFVEVAEDARCICRPEILLPAAQIAAQLRDYLSFAKTRSEIGRGGEAAGDPPGALSLGLPLLDDQGLEYPLALEIWSAGGQQHAMKATSRLGVS
jgi:hypothetical protein